MEVFQEYTVKQMDEKSLLQYASMAATMVNLGHASSKITVTIPGDSAFSITLYWSRCVRFLKDICTPINPSKTNINGRQLIEEPYKLAHSMVSQPPIVIDDSECYVTGGKLFVSTSYSCFIAG